MKICDRSWQRDGHPVPATIEITITGREVEELYNLCPTEHELLLSFLNSPADWTRVETHPADKVKRLRTKS